MGIDRSAMNRDRPNPDDLLARVQAEETPARRGKLKIFFGYAAGVGKTFAMLESAHREKAAGIDVVVGYVEPHGRPETEALLHGLEILPIRSVPYRGVTLKEFDLDAALARHPKLILVDELAHTNADGLRHSKRWQDVEELLDAGIDVYSTLNVQHVESLNDVIAQITGVVVRETLPDSVLERADDMELVDLTPDELIERLREGKVYLSQQAERALQHFFQKSNLVALREMSLRQVARRLSQDVQAARREKASQSPWGTNERLLVCVGPSPSSAKLIRTAKRMAAAFGADWLAVAVEPPAAGPRQAARRQRIAQHLRLAEQLGAETHTVFGDDVAATVIAFARSRNVTKIVVGKTAQPRWKRLLFGSMVDALLDRSGDIDVYVIRGEPEARPRAAVFIKRPAITWSNYVWTTLVVALCGLMGWLSSALHLTEANTVMVFLLGVAFVAARFGRGPAIAAAVASVLVFDFFFVPPTFQFAVSDAQYLLTFAVMLAIGIIISTLTARIRDQLRSAQQLQDRTAALFRLTKQLTEVAGSEFLIRSAGQQLRTLFDGEVVVFVRDHQRALQLRFGEETSVAKHDVNAVVAQWVADHDQIAGAGTDTLPNATALFAPLIGSQSTIGAVGIRSQDPDRFSDPDQRRLLETCASLIALSLERDQSVLEASEARLRVETEEMRNSLLSSVSHDLRTPLAVIAGVSANLLAREPHGDGDARREGLQTIAAESQRLSRLVDNLLNMTRLEAGVVTLDKQWHVLEEIVGSALNRTQKELSRHEVKVKIPPDFSLMLLDGVLVEQVFVNLLENAARYTPAGSRIEISANRMGTQLEIRVADNGPGLTPGSESRVLEKFYRGQPASGDNRRGVGLGLAICQAIVRAHGGRIAASNRSGGGAEFVITLRAEESPPRVVLDEIAVESGA
jgi:two-component system, OmpR family, sensor histidine kinase KdpD